MAASPKLKVYFGSEYRASAKYAEDAAVLVAVLGDGATIRYGHSVVVWREGSEEQPAAESYDAVRDTIAARLQSARDPESTVYKAQAREDAAAKREGRSPRLVATLEDAWKIPD